MIVDRPDMGIIRNPELASETHIIMLGGSGLVGSRILEMDRGIVIPNQRIDITQADEIHRVLEQYAGKTLVNFAAYTNVGAAENLRALDDDPWLVNVIGAENVALACAKHGIHLVHISTDFVFNGAKDNQGPYTEDAQPVQSPDGITWYGWTKAVAEQKVTDALVNGQLSILRIAYPYRAHFADKNDFARDIQLRHSDGNLYPMYTDQYITPTFIDDLPSAIRMIQDQQDSGIFHVASPTICTPHDFASYLLGQNVDTNTFPSESPRPQYGGLDVRKTQETLGLQFRTWQQGIDDMLKQQTA